MCFNSRKNWVRVTEPLQWLEIWQTCGSESGRPSPGEGFAWLGRWLLPQMGLPRWLRWGSPGGSDGAPQVAQMGLPRWLTGKASACQQRRRKRCSFDPRVGMIPGEGNASPLQYSCLGNPTDRGAWWAADHGVTKSQTRRSDWAPSQVPKKVGFINKGNENRVWKRYLHSHGNGRRMHNGQGTETI